MDSHRTSLCLTVDPSFIHQSVGISFPDDNLSKHQWILTKLSICIDIMEIRFGIAYGQISSIFDSYLPAALHTFVSGR